MEGGELFCPLRKKWAKSWVILIPAGETEQRSFLRIVTHLLKILDLRTVSRIHLTRVLRGHGHEAIKKDSKTRQGSGEGSYAQEFSRQDDLQEYVQRYWIEQSQHRRDAHRQRSTSCGNYDTIEDTRGKTDAIAEKKTDIVGQDIQFLRLRNL